ncbi:MAG: MBL fold metallo-hydrolase [Gemmatimonadaceae bacterium]
MRIVAFALAACCPVLAAQSRPIPSAADSTTIITLGTGTPRPLPAVMGPATAVVVGQRVFLFDAGTGVERRLAAAHLPVNGVDALFLTHLQRSHSRARRPCIHIVELRSRPTVPGVRTHRH